MSEPDRNHPLMECGHAANAVNAKTGEPVCVICVGISPGADEVAADQTPFAGRVARCSYYGRRTGSGSRFGNECIFNACETAGLCRCEKPSSNDLPFFEYKPKGDYDEFYCGCHSWS